MSDEFPESDRRDGAPHPRETDLLFGHAQAETTFLDAYNSGRLPHAWLLTGPEGAGKASFAWRAARFLLATEPPGDDMFGGPPPPTSLDISPDHPVAHRLLALSEPGLCLLRRPWDEKAKRLKTQLTVDEVRQLKSFFSMSAGGNGRRVVIVDSADEMNTSAANALLKELEEPPKDAVLFLISHRPSGLLPTIRSRCRTLRFSGLSAGDLTQALTQAGQTPPDNADALTELAQGSVGEAVRLMQNDGLGLYADLTKLIGSLPRLDRAIALKLAEATGGKATDRFDLTLSLLDTLLTRLARTGATGQTPPEIAPGEAQILARLSPDPHRARAWADLAATLTAKARRGRAVNLDPATLVFDMFLEMDRMAAALPA
ncbi:MAG: DNA polymerase III subunit delta' [Pseudomonadota bacterium]